MPEHQLIKVLEPRQLGEALERAYPGHEDMVIDVLREDMAWGFVLTSEGETKAFRCTLSLDRRWTVSPVYCM